jgi:hypothetical protein
MAADVRLPGKLERLVRRVDVAGDLLREIEVVDRHPSRIHDVDEHQRVVVREVDEDVVRRVVRALEARLDPLASDLEGVGVLEGDVRDGTRRVAVPNEEPLGFLVGDSSDLALEPRADEPAGRRGLGATACPYCAIRAGRCRQRLLKRGGRACVHHCLNYQTECRPRDASSPRAHAPTSSSITAPTVHRKP